MKAAWVDAVREAASLELKMVPPSTLAHLEHVVVDTVGVMIAGARAPEICALVDAEYANGAIRHGPDATGATVFAPERKRANADVAAFINATAGTVLELDEGMRPTGHPSIHVVPAALAVAETVGADGSSLLLAILAGYETTARLFQAFRLHYPVHPHGHFGSIGASVATALLTGADPVDVAKVAATTPLLPIWNACYEGATVRNTYTGMAAQNGIRAERLASAGFTGSEENLVEAFGTIAGELADPEALSAPLDYDNLAINRNYFKRHGTCALSHSAIDAVLGMHLPPVDEITHIRVETVSNNSKIARLPRSNDLSARFSLPYAVAAAVLSNQSDLQEFNYRPGVAELAERVEVTVNKELDAQWPDASPARVVIGTVRGEIVNTVSNPHGHYSSPLTEEELWKKFRTNVGRPAGRMWRSLTHLREVADCSFLFEDLQ